VLQEAYRAGAEFSRAQDKEALATFEARASGPDVVCELRDEFESLGRADGETVDYAVEWFDLWFCVVEEFAEINGSPSTTLAATEESTPATDARDRRRIGGYLAGWAWFKVESLAAKRSADARFRPLLARLILRSVEDLPPEDDARPYLAARQQFDGLQIPTPALITAFTLARDVLAENLEAELYSRQRASRWRTSAVWPRCSRTRACTELS